MLDSIKEFFTAIFILMLIFPPFGIIVLIAIVAIIEHIFGFDGGGGGGGESPDYRGEEAMRFLKSTDPKGYKRFTDKYPNEKID